MAEYLEARVGIEPHDACNSSQNASCLRLVNYYSSKGWNKVFTRRLVSVLVSADALEKLVSAAYGFPVWIRAIMLTNPSLRKRDRAKALIDETPFGQPKLQGNE